MIIITGASKGIGQFLFEKFTASGHKVIGTYNSSIPKEANASQYFKVDISNSEQVAQWIDSIKDDLSEIVVLNCAGGNANAFAHKVNPADWKNIIDINLSGTFNVINTLLPIMREQNFGRIINFSSVVAQIGVPGTSAYAASKAGLWGMTRSIAVENASKGITINNLNLGYFNIGMISEVPEKFQEVIKQKIPAGDFGDPINIFKAVNFLMESDYTNGVSIDINGGMH